jgi:hypothetical protein
MQLLADSAEAGFIDAMKEMARICHEMGEHKNALMWFERIYAFCTDAYGESDPSTLLALSNLAAGYGRVGDHKQLLRYAEESYRLHCIILGEEHPRTLNAFNTFAYAH